MIETNTSEDLPSYLLRCIEILNIILCL